MSDDECPTCGGSGEVYDSGEDTPVSDNDEDYDLCPDCGGTGLANVDQGEGE